MMEQLVTQRFLQIFAFTFSIHVHQEKRKEKNRSGEEALLSTNRHGMHVQVQADMNSITHQILILFYDVY